MFAIVCGAQGVFYVLTGLWPLLHMPSFIRVTGPKTDVWLVRTVAALALAIGLALLVALWEPPHHSIAALGVCSALAFASIDVFYVTKRRIGPVYLLDAAAEAVLVVGWGLWALSRSS